ncbi:radical SAM protein [Ancylomarina euxinus]|uniref:Radical SAM protein n=1 Tax=Ancylomarina euxinus TaxID=2283627 RepID=A0A425XWJ9_9BACT|nr:radical SAM protein [Ancylomarina euxinus]MCZ4696400.1 radical SAM protein [Ancylomarina euxinus]RRG19021.1 radical SAM protein [Ancylomarina euxinus]
MNYTGPVYRPPYEANTLLLEVTVGCAHNKCTFCTMYHDVKFSIAKADRIEQDLQEAQRLYPNVKRIFLVNGDAFVLSANRLKNIAEQIHKYLPKVEIITMYASINNIMHKSDEELAELAKLGIGDLWIGVETGLGDALDYLNKGASLSDTEKQLERLNIACITFFYGFMFGAAGKNRGVENAIANAKLINKVKPLGIVPTTLNVNNGTKLEADIANGSFQMATEKEILEEQIKTIELINVPTYYMGIHVINTVSFDTQLPKGKLEATEKIKLVLNNTTKEVLNSVPERHSI